MPARVHAILVVRPEGRTPAALHLKRTLAALEAQTRPIDALTIVLCGADPALREIAATSGAEGVITASAGTPFAHATALATPRLTGDAVWLLAQDTAPEPDALQRLAGALELSPSLAIAAPKLVKWDEGQVHVMTHALHYGLGVFEGIRAYKTHDGRLAVFRLREAQIPLANLKATIRFHRAEPACVAWEDDAVGEGVTPWRHARDEQGRAERMGGAWLGVRMFGR